MPDLPDGDTGVERSPVKREVGPYTDRLELIMDLYPLSYNYFLIEPGEVDMSITIPRFYISSVSSGAGDIRNLHTRIRWGFALDRSLSPIYWLGCIINWGDASIKPLRLEELALTRPNVFVIEIYNYKSTGSTIYLYLLHNVIRNAV